MSSVQDYRDLRVWQAGMERVERVYRLTDQFPDWENYGVAAQVRRAAVSIPFNIAEGHAQEHLAEYLHHLAIARGSLAEVQTQIEIAFRLGYISPDAFQTRMLSGCRWQSNSLPSEVP